MFSYEGLTILEGHSQPDQAFEPTNIVGSRGIPDQASLSGRALSVLPKLEQVMGPMGFVPTNIVGTIGSSSATHERSRYPQSGDNDASSYLGKLFFADP
jgi:hypothetical protein